MNEFIWTDGSTAQPLTGNTTKWIFPGLRDTPWIEPLDNTYEFPSRPDVRDAEIERLQRELAEAERSKRVYIEPTDLQKRFERLEDLFGEALRLGDDGKAFLRSVVQSPEDRTLLLVLADWLEEANCPEGAAKIRLFVAKPGDVVMVRIKYPLDPLMSSASLKKKLREAFPDNRVVFLFDGQKLEALGDRELEKIGLRRI